ncbi:uncharacterized protein LOC143231324 isoform X2 [Tachypleus tridentatus]|uniref:uncharacterized protein LOC143231324 isoform X2 n=1 Tax=Tachypleus tridentatus TaxID=6853 RepID=UPI003FD42E17
MFPCTPPAESARSNIAYLGMISQCLLIHNLLEGLKKVHSRCALLILGKCSPLYHEKEGGLIYMYCVTKILPTLPWEKKVDNFICTVSAKMSLPPTWERRWTSQDIYN